MTNHEHFFGTPESCSEVLKNGSPLFLEMYGDLLASHPSLISLLQGVFCKYLIQNSRAEDTQTLSLTLRVIFNLFQSLKSFLKVQLEVFITSVHIRLADTSRSRGSLTSREPQTAHDFLPKEI